VPVSRTLQVISGPHYAESPYEPLPPNTHDGLHNAYGPYYILVLGHGAAPRKILAVAANATGATVDERGWLSLPHEGGSEVLIHDIASPVLVGRWMYPEQAVIQAANATGLRVASMPRLVLQGHPYGPLDPVWKMRVEEPLQLSAGARQVHSDVIYLSWDGQLKAAAGEAAPERIRAVSRRHARGAAVDVIELVRKPGFETGLNDVQVVARAKGVN
jgi:hypothetical protein